MIAFSDPTVFKLVFTQAVAVLVAMTGRQQTQAWL